MPNLARAAASHKIIVAGDPRDVDAQACARHGYLQPISKLCLPSAPPVRIYLHRAFAASRQLGFLQQLTDNKSVLQRALEKLAFTNETIVDHDPPVMDEAEAASIEMGDTDTLASFVAATVKITGMDRPAATALVRQRAAALAQISAEVTSRTLASLRSIVSSCGVLPDRKLLFLWKCCVPPL